MVISMLDAVAQTLSTRAREIEAGTRSAGLGENADMRQVVMRVLDSLESSSLDPHNPAEMKLWFMGQLSFFTAIRLFIKWGVFEKVPTGKGAAISYAELAASLDADVDAALIGWSSQEFLYRAWTLADLSANSRAARLGQVLVAHGALTHAGSGTVAHTDLSRALSTPSGRAPLNLA